MNEAAGPTQNGICVGRFSWATYYKIVRMKVCFKRVIRRGATSSSDDIWLSRVMELPFVPPVGMEVCDGDWGSTVESLAFKDGIVFAFEEPICLTGSGIASVVDESIKEGWVTSQRILAV